MCIRANTVMQFRNTSFRSHALPVSLFLALFTQQRQTHSAIARWLATKSCFHVRSPRSGGRLLLGGRRRTKRPPPPCRIKRISAGFACGSNLARSRVTSPFFLSYQTYANSRRDGDERRAANERGRGCGKVRQYEQTCRWSVPRRYSPWKIIPPRVRSFSLFRLFVFASCEQGNALRDPVRF